MINSQKKKEIASLFLAFLGIVLSLSLLSFHPLDSTIFKIYSHDISTRNWMGLFGAHLAWLLYTSIGFSSLVIPLALFALACLIFKNKKIHPLYFPSLFGFLILASSSFLGLLVGELPLRGQKILAGGMIGRFIAEKMINLFSPIGAFLITLAITVFAILLIVPWSMAELFLRAKELLSIFPKSLRRLSFPKVSTLINNFKKTQKELKPERPKIQQRNGRQQNSPKEESLEELFASRSETPLPVKKHSEVLPKTGSSSSCHASGSHGCHASGSQHGFNLPPIELLDAYETRNSHEDSRTLQKKAEVLTQKLADFGIHGEVVNILPGPVITTFEYVPAPGIKISRIVNLANDLTMALKALSIRIVAPIPGKAAVGIEVPNANRQLVPIRSIIESTEFQRSTAPLTMALGKDTTGNPVVTNLAKMPHLLIAGATGTGKSVCLNSILASFLFRNTPEILRLLLIDPKRIELSLYEGIPHLIHPVVTDVKKATKALHWAVEEMERRYELMAEENTRNIEGYNKKLLEEGRKDSIFPYLVIIIDELADLMMVASREVEESITRLAQMARAAGIHLILATQRPSVDVITGLIKANIPSRISFQVSSKIDSRTILDTTGAETLLGAGDMLFLPPGTAKLQRIHGAFISDKEVQRITEFWKEQATLVGWQSEQMIDLSEDNGSTNLDEDYVDEKYEEAVRLVIETRQASISMLQRRLRVGYNRAARMIEMMEKQGIVGPSDGIKPREVLVRN